MLGLISELVCGGRCGERGEAFATGVRLAPHSSMRKRKVSTVVVLKPGTSCMSATCGFGVC